MNKLSRPLTRQKPTSNLVLTQRDTQTFFYLHKYRFLTTDHIQALTGTSSRSKLNERLKRLFDHGYIDRPPIQHQTFAYASRRPLVHALGNEGAAYIEQSLDIELPKSVRWSHKNNRVKSTDFLLHTLGVSDFFVSTLCAVKNLDGVRFVDHDAVLAQSPRKTQIAEAPFSLPTAYTWFNGSFVKRSTVPDGVFALVDERGATAKTAFHFLEYDGNSMPVVRSTPYKSSIIQKLLGYADAYQRKLHSERFGYKNFRVLFITRGRDRIHSMVGAYQEHVQGLCPAGAFLFADYDDVMSRTAFSNVWIDGNGKAVLLVPR